MLPRELRCVSRDAQQLQLELWLDPQLPWFAGHFAQQAVLPGVAQIDWVLHYAKQWLGPDWAFASLEMVKFQSPLQPKQQLQLQLTWLADKQLLQFNYQRLSASGDYHNASTGKIRLCQRHHSV